MQQSEGTSEEIKGERSEREYWPLFLVWLVALALMGINTALGAVEFSGPFNQLWEWVTKGMGIISQSNQTP